MDFVPLAVVDGEGFDVPSVLVRTSSRENLNANVGSRYVSLDSLEDAFEEGITVDHPETELCFDLRARAETIAGRDVPLTELRPVLADAGHAALAIRNLAAFEAEAGLTA